MENLIATKDFCTYHEIEYTFINSLHDAGLVEVTVVDQSTYIPESELPRIEKMIRLHTDLEINVAGIEAIIYLLERVNQMQEEMRQLRNKPLLQ